MKRLQLVSFFSIAAVFACKEPTQATISRGDVDAGAEGARDDEDTDRNPDDDGDTDAPDDDAADDDGSPSDDDSDDTSGDDDGSDPDDVMFGGGGDDAGEGEPEPTTGSGGDSSGSGGEADTGDDDDGSEQGSGGDGSGGENADPGAGGASGSGTECAGHLDCQWDEHCDDGACRADGCLAGTSYCDGLAVMECEPSGRQYSLWGTCNGSRCVEFGNFASCEYSSCAPGVEYCLPGENLVRRCNDDGETTEVIEDCAASGEVCVGSLCYPVVCEAGERTCEGNSLLECSPEGHRMGSGGTCTSGRYCDAEAQACVRQICQPNVRVCDGNVATRCSETGLDYAPDGIDCSATGEVCSAGECKPVICSANEQFCENNGIRTCNGNGTSSTLLESCQAVTEYCDPATVTCQPAECAANSAWCEENVAYVCNALGSSSAQTDCATTNQFCLDGECLDLECLPDSRFCDGNVVMQCNAQGTSITVYDGCSEIEYCEGGVCRDMVCSPSLPGCDGDRAAVCNDEGSAYLGGGDECSSPEYCKDARCTDALFWEGFEDRQFYDWSGVITNNVSEVGIVLSAANGSSAALRIERTNIDGYGNGLSHAFDSIQPSVVRWWVNSPYAGWLVGFFELRQETGDQLLRVHFNSSSVVINNVSTGADYEANTWYPFELQLDWVAQTADLIFDGAVVATDVPFSNPGTSIQALDIYNYEQNGVAFFDEIEFR